GTGSLKFAIVSPSTRYLNPPKCLPVSNRLRTENCAALRIGDWTLGVERWTFAANERERKQHPAQRGRRSPWDIDHSWWWRSKKLERHSLQARHVGKKRRHKESISEYCHHPSGRRGVRARSCRFRSDPLR